MTDYAHLVNLLYKHYGTWRKVAKACARQGGSSDPRYYWKVAHNKLERMSERNEKAIEVVASSSAVTRRYRRKFQRKNITVSTALYQRMNAVKTANDETWEQFMQRALDALEKGD